MGSLRTCVCFGRTFTKLYKCSNLYPVFGLTHFSSISYSMLSYTRIKPNLVSLCSVWTSRNFSNVTGVLSRPKNDEKDYIPEGKLKTRILDGTADSHTQDSKKKEEEKRKADEFSKKMMNYSFIAFGTVCTGVACLLVYRWGGPPTDSQGQPISDEYSTMPAWKAYIMRTYKEMLYFDKMIKEPSREKLLPDPLTEPYYQPPYTLVLEMTGVLVHPDWTYQTGWRFKKRPGIDFFLQQVGPPLYEIVIYTSEQGFTAFPILDTLDPHGFIMYRLFRDATRYLNGSHIKDLSCLNRDLSKVIYIDWNEKAYELNPENAFRVKRWTGNDEDRSLIDLAVFLRTIATSGVEDVRTVLEFYNQFDDPLEAFRENHRKLQEQKEQQRQMEETKEKKSLTSAFRGGIFSHR